MRYFLHLAYIGTAYHGWQRQQDLPTVQGIIEETLSRIFKTELSIHGCGRTDAGVHASQYFAHIDLQTNPDAQTIDIINRQLPGDISLFEFIPVPEKANAQLHAKTRTYRYLAHTSPNALLHHRSGLFLHAAPQLSLMREAAEIVLQTTDFAHCCKTPERQKSTLCKVLRLEIKRIESLFQFEFEADHFLRGMIRILVQRLFDVGNGKLSLKAFELILKGLQKDSFLNMAPACGLYLSNVDYENISPKKVNTFLISDT